MNPEVTKENFFEEIEKKLKSSLTQEGLEHAKTYGLKKIQLGNDFTIKNKKHYWGNIAHDLMLNSYEVNSIKNEFSDASMGFNYYLEDIITYYQHKSFCKLYDPQAKLCSKPKESLLVFNDAEKVESVEKASYPELLTFYRDFSGFVDGVMKEHIAALK